MPEENEQEDPDRLLNPMQVARRLGVSVMTVRRLIQQEEIEHIRVGGQIRFTADQVTAYIEKRRAFIQENWGRKIPDTDASRRRQRQLVAQRAVQKAVKDGRLPHPSKVRCTDCCAEWTRSGPRHEYDHYINYEPDHHLSVQVVCRPCHMSREADRRKDNEVIP